MLSGGRTSPPFRRSVPMWTFSRPRCLPRPRSRAAVLSPAPAPFTHAGAAAAATQYTLNTLCRIITHSYALSRSSTPPYLPLILGTSRPPLPGSEVFGFIFLSIYSYIYINVFIPRYPPDETRTNLGTSPHTTALPLIRPRTYGTRHKRISAA